MKENFKAWTFFFYPHIYLIVRNSLKSYTRNKSLNIIDVGGRRSPYTVGINANFTILDKPPENKDQWKLKLGMTNSQLEELIKSRSNLKEVISVDLLQSNIQSSSYDGTLCVEVIEHVKEDKAFISELARIIKPGGFLILTTPNGDYIKNEPPNYNPDHVRHYTKEQLSELLNIHFKEVQVVYAVRTGKFRVWGLKPFSIKKPLRLMKSLIGNIINHWESRKVEKQSARTAHLFVICKK